MKKFHPGGNAYATKVQLNDHDFDFLVWTMSCESHCIMYLFKLIKFLDENYAHAEDKLLH